MKGFLKFLIVFGVILLLSVVLAPLLFQFLPYKFERIFNRLIMIFSLAAVVFFVRIRKSTLERFGLMWQPDSLKLFAVPWILSLAVLSLLAAVRVGLGNGVWSLQDVSVFSLSGRVLLAFGAALLIGVIEEFFFRGFVFLTIKDKWRWGFVPSVLVTSAFYAVVHFVGEKKPFIDDTPTWVDSLKLIGAPFMSLAQWEQIWPGMVGLFILGVVLIFLFVRTGSLYPSIGLHAGCVFFLKMDGRFVNYQGEGALWFGTGNYYDGVLGWIFLVILGAVSLIVVNKKRVKAFA